MKKMNIIVRYACVATILAATPSCVKVERPDSSGAEPGRKEICFPDPLVSSTTKAEGSVAYPRDGKFGVYGILCLKNADNPEGTYKGWDTPGSIRYINGAEFFYDQSTGSWTSSPKYYWPEKGSGSMSLFCWAPYSIKEEYAGKFTMDGRGLSINGFNSGKNATTDLLYSVPVFDREGSGDIDIIFRHALAAIQFRAKPGQGHEDAKVRILKVLVGGFIKEADFNQNCIRTGGDNPEWTLGESGYTLDSPLEITTEGASAYIIPQTIGTEVKAKIYYTLQIGDGVAVPAVTDWIMLSEAKSNGSTLQAWERSTRYVYNIVVDASMIRFDVDVFSWNNSLGGGGNIQ